MLDIAIEFPTKPYIKAFMENRYGAEHPRYGRVVELKRATWESKYFYNLTDDAPRRRDKEMGQYPTKMTLLMSYDLYVNRRIRLTPTVVIEFNTFLTDIIKEGMRTYVDCLVASGQTIYRSIQLYQEANGFTEDNFPSDSIKKDLRRNTDIRKRKKHSQLAVNQ